ncbi:MAG: beta-phosphoglucomutase [Roseburia inulinivorans]|nr:beta-phosphoglucomutase [Roseburia inulinivorans]
MIKGVIFDLDGVLVSTDEMHYLAWKRLADELGIHGFTRKDNERQRGVSRMASLEIVLEKSDTVYTEEEKVKLAEKKNDYYKELLQQLDDGAVLKGAKEALIKLREMGILIGVGSVSKNTPVILEKTGLLPLIDKVSCGLDITKSKPDPEVFLVAAKKLALPVEECLVVEDAAAGIQAAKAAGMRSLAVGPYYEKLGAAYQTPGLYAVDHWEEMLK